MRKSRGGAIASLVLGLFFWVPLLNLVLGASAVLAGARSIANIKKEPKKYGGIGFAIAGIILGLIPLIFLLIGIGLCFSGQKSICGSIGLGFLQ